MKLISVQLENYKSIQDSGELFLSKKLNVLAGKNNTGKTALLQALYLFFVKAHFVNIREIKKEVNFINQNTTQKNQNNRTNTATLTLKFSLSTEEIIYLIDEEEKPLYYTDFKIVLSSNNNNVGISEIVVLAENNSIFHFYYDSKRDTYILDDIYGEHQPYDIPRTLKNIFEYIKSNLVYIESARSLSVSGGTDVHQMLNNNGDNLHSYFFTLHNNKEEIFDKIVTMFKSIFTDVESLKTVVVLNSQTKIHIQFEGETESFPLYECGSGYTQVLMMLCILYTTRDKIILYDEPHLYLHPSAEKAIYDLVHLNDNLQFIFTTHSPILINYPTPKNLFLVKKVKGYSDYSLMTNIQDILKDIGIQNGDFALADKVLFVEGETEEKIVPEILSAFNMKQIGYNYKILNMKGTGNAFSKSSAMSNNSQKLTQIFDGLGSSPIPYCILVDRDERSEDQISKLELTYGKNIVILNKREIENYFLLKPAAISAYLKRLTNDSSITDETIQTFIDSCYNNTDDWKLFPKSQTCPENDIVGSEVLERLFSQYESHYNKVDDGYALTIEILRSEPEVLQPIAEQLRNFIELK